MGEEIPEWTKKYNDIILNHPENIQEATELKNKNIPEHLYKYYSFDEHGYWENGLNGQIYLACPQSFNDPFDCYLTIDEESIEFDLDIQKCIRFMKSLLGERRDKSIKKEAARLRYAADPVKETVKYLESQGIKCNKPPIDNYTLSKKVKEKTNKLFKEYFKNCLF